MNSPCNKVCVMDANNRYCLGCYRTLGEIARWGGMTDTERRLVMASLVGRQADGPISSGGKPPAAESAS